MIGLHLTISALPAPLKQGGKMPGQHTSKTEQYMVDTLNKPVIIIIIKHNGEGRLGLAQAL